MAVFFLLLFLADFQKYIFFGVVFFRFDPERVKAVGPDRACAEWCLRCGASVRSEINQFSVGLG